MPGLCFIGTLAREGFFFWGCHAALDAASPFKTFAFAFFYINSHENYFVVYCVVDDALPG